MSTEPFDVVIRHGRVVTSRGTEDTDVGIRGGRIAAIGPGLSAAGETIDARGLLVLPGGVDAHCHIDQMVSSGARTADDFESASVAAAFGGTTTLISFAAQHRGQSLRAVVEDYKSRAHGKSVVDYGFHLILTDATAQTLDHDLPALVDEGFTSVKIYLTYDALRLDDRAALDVLTAIRREGAMPLIHAESHDLIAWFTDRLLQSGHRQIQHLATARPSLAERDAVHHAVSLAELVNVPILLVHMSSADAVEQVRWARNRGMPVYAETCPQYLVLTADSLRQPAFEAAKFCCSPPLRDKTNQDAVWSALADGTLSILSSDHSAFEMEGPDGKLRDGPDSAFNRVQYGMPGLETRLPLIFSEGVVGGRLSLERFVEVTATEPARLYGLSGRKGVIALGADADIVLWDAKRRMTISPDTLHDGLGWTPYDGRQVTGMPVTTMVRGTVICRDGERVGTSGHGQLLARDRPEASLPTAPPRTGFDVVSNRFVCEELDQ
ncbi:dihydropyrimidinase [Microvirga brassicacearum]|uniref:Dihydropyrimidinase n=1 Tax=Microvirga brassicacearum TaxID=2580413 RepID=A0A5N3PD68_9HYPH|nr:dihydropyrimidinase [Microvirga brassicacearum]KAB0267688.1 dihydropyrimidinase [Microvirga brassicacearum]